MGASEKAREPLHISMVTCMLVNGRLERSTAKERIRTQKMIRNLWENLKMVRSPMASGSSRMEHFTLEGSDTTNHTARACGCLLMATSSLVNTCRKKRKVKTLEVMRKRVP